MPDQPTLQIIDDDSALRGVLEHALRLAGFRVLEAADGESGLEMALRERPALIVLDVQMPGLDGIAVCSRLRAAGFHAPILMLTGQARVEDRVTGLNAGADDYLAKPFAREEFLARIHALLRRSVKTAPTFELALGDTRIDLTEKTATRAGQPLELTKTEYALLHVLALNAGKPVSRENILNVVWGYTRLPTTRTIDTHIWRLRKKIGDDGETPRWIRLVHGRGYCLSLADRSEPNEA